MSQLSFEEEINKSKRELNRFIKPIFSGQITLNFMLDIMYSMISLYPDLNSYIQAPNNIESIFSGHAENIFYVLCEYIVGYHRSRTIFLSDSERTKLENDVKYRSELIDDIYQEIKVRHCIDGLIRNPQLIKGDKFLLFPIPYCIAVIESKFVQLASKSKKMPLIYLDIANKTLAALSLLQDNLADSSYAACRIIIEDYLKATIFRNCVEAQNECEKFSLFEIKHSLGYKYDDEFLSKYNNRKNQKSTNRINYLHYGWVDVIPNYHKTVKKQPYTFWGIKDLIVERFSETENKDLFESLDSYHDICNGYIHGSMGVSKYPVLHYFEITSILVNTSVSAYTELCNELNEDTSIDGFDVISAIRKHFNFFIEAYCKRSTENFEKYYKNFKW